jgi:hypothetical protein
MQLQRVQIKNEGPMNDNRFREPLDKRYREKLAELEALVDEARTAQSQCSLITARIAGVTAELATLGQIGGTPPRAELELAQAPFIACPKCGRQWLGDPNTSHTKLRCYDGCGHSWDNPRLNRHDGVPCTDRIWSEVDQGTGGTSGVGIKGVTAR